MSRIGKKSITLPKDVEVSLKDGLVTVKGPKGELAKQLSDVVRIEETEQEDGTRVLNVTVENPDEQSALWGTARAHIQNMVTGVVEPWSKTLELNGVGFKMNIKGKKLTMSLGFSHEVIYELPESVDGSIEANRLTLASINRDIVGKVAAEIRAFKKPEPYKGKGFRYMDEVIRRKAGKAAKSE